MSRLVVNRGKKPPCTCDEIVLKSLCGVVRQESEIRLVYCEDTEFSRGAKLLIVFSLSGTRTRYEEPEN